MTQQWGLREAGLMEAPWGCGEPRGGLLTQPSGGKSGRASWKRSELRPGGEGENQAKERGRGLEQRAEKLV